MKTNWPNVFMISLCLILASMTGFALYHAHSYKKPVEFKAGYLIEIPPQLLDITSPETRIFLERTFINEASSNQLLSTCKDQEKYVFKFNGRPDGNFGTLVSIEIDSDDALVNIQHNEADIGSDKTAIKSDTYFFRTNKSNLNDVFSLLQNMEVWDSDQNQYPLCYEAPRFYFEACNDGRYAARNHGCSLERESNQLLTLFEKIKHPQRQVK